jgi:hypothetical protein
VPVFPGDLFLGEAYGRGYAIVKPHCHGVDCRRFSQTDDVSDKSLFSAVTSLLLSLEAVRAVAECDVLFGCMEGVEGRHVLNRLVLSIRCRIFDVGVRLMEPESPPRVAQFLSLLFAFLISSPRLFASRMSPDVAGALPIGQPSARSRLACRPAPERRTHMHD